MLDTLLPFISNHSHLTYFVIFVTSFSESLALVGLLIPGTVVMFGIGALVGMGGIALKPTLIMAALGAIAGDAVSYWLGRHYQERLKTIWPFSKYDQVLEEGEKFFRKHGGKSVFFGRFIGPIRPVIPIVAGIMNMPGYHFTFVNVTSAIAWALAYVLPGVVLGTSLTIAGIVSTRLIVLTLLVCTLLWIFFWVSKKIFKLLILKSNRWLETLYRWTKANADRQIKTTRSFTSFLLPRYEEEAPIFFVMGFLFIFCLSGFLVVAQSVFLKLSIIQWDKNIFYFLQSIRNPIFDKLFVIITEMGDFIVFVLVFLALILVLLLQKAYVSTFYSLISLVGSIALVRLFKWTFQLQRPIAGLYHGISMWGFPSGHTAHSAVLCGTMTIILMRALRQLKVSSRTTRIFNLVSLSTAVTVSSAIGFSRIYLGAHWLSDVLGGFFLGWTWVSFWTLLYLKSTIERINPRTFVILPVSIFIIVGGWNISSHMQEDLLTYAPHLPINKITLSEWIHYEWKKLPPWRTDMSGKIKQPFLIQYAGSTEALTKELAIAGWQRANSIGLKSVLTTLSPKVTLDDLPIFPHLYNGKFEKLILFKDLDKTRLVLRLWSTRLVILPRDRHLYIGTIESQVSKKITPWITVPIALPDYITPLKEACKNMSERNFRIIKRKFFHDKCNKHGTTGKIKWDGTVLLLFI